MTPILGPWEDVRGSPQMTLPWSRQFWSVLTLPCMHERGCMNPHSGETAHDGSPQHPMIQLQEQGNGIYPSISFPSQGRAAVPRTCRWAIVGRSAGFPTWLDLGPLGENSRRQTKPPRRARSLDRSSQGASRSGRHGRNLDRRTGCRPGSKAVWLAEFWARKPPTPPQQCSRSDARRARRPSSRPREGHGLAPQQHGKRGPGQ